MRKIYALTFFVLLSHCVWLGRLTAQTPWETAPAVAATLPSPQTGSQIPRGQNQQTERIRSLPPPPNIAAPRRPAHVPLGRNMQGSTVGPLSAGGYARVGTAPWSNWRGYIETRQSRIKSYI